jgi:hypothetical protein
MMAIAVGLGKRVRVDGGLGGWVDGLGEACPEGLGVRVDGCVTEA